MRRATIIAGAPVEGAGEFYRTLIGEADLLVAADSGAVPCRDAGRVPDILVGDFDSIPSDVLEWAEEGGSLLRRAPAAKDESDLDLALSAAREAGCDSAIVAAAWSGRLDHTCVALGSVASEDDLIVDIVDPGLAGWILRAGSRSSVTLGPRGAECSVLALLGPARVTLTGMRYGLISQTINPLSSLGLSNVIESESADVLVEDGVVLVLSSPNGENPMATRTTGG